MSDLSRLELEEKVAALAEALRHAEVRATAGQLALEVMHEIRSPLDALGHFTELALDEASDPKRVRTFLRLAIEQMDHARQVASQTLDYARQSAAPTPSDLVALSEAALRIHQQRIKSKRVRLVKDVPETLVAQAYSGELLQVLSNLILNAVEALPEQGTLVLKLRKRNEQVHLLVVDNGPGISPEHVDSIFQPFFTTKDEGGNGLGVAITKRIVEHHHGKIRVRSSVRPNKSGTAFRICFPARAMDQASLSAQPAA